VLREDLLDIDPSTALSIVNSIWYREGFPVKQSFLDLNRTHYAAETNGLDFSKPESVTKINEWCARSTGNRIKTVVEQIPDDAIMYIINAVYFKGIWRSKFDPANTRKESFHAANGTARQVDMMHQTQIFKYSSGENFAGIELPYGNGAFSMILMLPHEGKTVDDVLKSLTNDALNGILRTANLFDVHVALPRFKLECKYALHEKTLPAMGMKIPFSSVKADFGGISDIPLYISGVFHKTFVELNEEGTEAAAVTSTEIGVTSVGQSPIDFRLNRPFLFVIMERSTGAILFTGKIENP
jgi:serpin B